MPVELLLHLATGHEWIVNVHDNAGVDYVGPLLGDSRGVPLVTWAMLSTDELGYEHSHSSDWHSLGIEQMVCVSVMVDRSVARLRLNFGLLSENSVVM